MTSIAQPGELPGPVDAEDRRHHGEAGDQHPRHALAEAADVLTRFPIAVQLRYLQTMREIASERNTTTFFPLPIDLFMPLLRAFGDNQAPKP